MFLSDKNCISIGYSFTKVALQDADWLRPLEALLQQMQKEPLWMRSKVS